MLVNSIKGDGDDGVEDCGQGGGEDGNEDSVEDGDEDGVENGREEPTLTIPFLETIGNRNIIHPMDRVYMKFIFRI